MPQAEQELRDLMQHYFGSEVDDRRPSAFLLERGYTEKAGLWTIGSEHFVTMKEWLCLRFLHDEWDYDFKLESANDPMPHHQR